MNKNILIRVSVVISYLFMILINALANILPINNMTTGDISDKYGNLFAPTGLTFSIWGLIYLLLGIYVIYQLVTSQKKELFNDIGFYFILTSLFNISWIFSWHYDLILLSVVFMIILLLLLIKIANILRKQELSLKNKIIVCLPFSIYFGWITVATIANITTFLVSINWNGFGISDYIWTSIILVIGAIIGIIRMNLDKNFVYGLVFIWAYIGILIKHTSLNGFAGQYSGVIYTVVVCLISFVIAEILLLRKQAIINK